jgi:DNA polymerase I-like protein with 3'-5' exonuclease and polymerase domains
LALILDIEANGFLESVTTIHCLVLKDTETGEVTVATDPYDKLLAIRKIPTYTHIVGHNIIKYDLPVIKKIYPEFRMPHILQIDDTLVMSRLIYAELAEIDTKLMAQGKLPGKLFRSHSLEAWGHRLGEYKDNYQGGFDELSQEMIDYCIQDVEVTHKLYDKLLSKNYSRQALDLEREVAELISRQERYGFLFDIQSAAKLYGELAVKRDAILREMQDTFEPMVIERVSEKTGKPLKAKVIEFNPSSRQQIAQRLIKKYGWKPEVFTPAGQPKVDETILSKLDYPEATKLAEYFMLEKRIGQIAEGEQAWLKQVDKTDRIHGSVITNGAVTGRATHNNPNLAQVPSVAAPYGWDCRSLFKVPKGRKLVGADLSGLELRCLAHYMAKWDDGAYGKILLEGDIHTENQLAAGLPTRNDAKTFIYAFLYGAGNEKIGKIIGKGAEEGLKLKKKFLKKLPALKKLVENVQAKAEKDKVLKGLDGRLLHVRSSHAALNTLLQSAGALIAKQALIFFDCAIADKGWGDRVQQVAWIHDEIQVECDEEIADEVGRLAIESFAEAGREFDFRIPITGEYKVGTNWAETH